LTAIKTRYRTKVDGRGNQRKKFRAIGDVTRTATCSTHGLKADDDLSATFSGENLHEKNLRENLGYTGLCSIYGRFVGCTFEGASVRSLLLKLSFFQASFYSVTSTSKGTRIFLYILLSSVPEYAVHYSNSKVWVNCPLVNPSPISSSFLLFQSSLQCPSNDPAPPSIASAMGDYLANISNQDTTSKQHRKSEPIRGGKS